MCDMGSQERRVIYNIALLGHKGSIYDCALYDRRQGTD
jgi:hypothetical protein